MEQDLAEKGSIELRASLRALQQSHLYLLVLVVKGQHILLHGIPKSTGQLQLAWLVPV